MESNNYFITVTIDWHRVACIAYIVSTNHIFLTKIVNQWVAMIR